MNNSLEQTIIDEFTRDLATQLGIRISSVRVVEGKAVGCLDSYLLNISSDGNIVSALVYQTEMEDLANGLPCNRLELKIRSALSRLKMMLEP
jgi:translation initiation factor 6 (eIF-6)